MGLRRLYFLLDGLLDRLVHLSTGLAVILGFIGVKLILHALHQTTDVELPQVGSGAWALVPQIGIATSLAVILGTLAVTTVLSLATGGRRTPSPSPRNV